VTSLYFVEKNKKKNKTVEGKDRSFFLRNNQFERVNKATIEFIES
jgi:hypothetical protein